MFVLVEVLIVVLLAVLVAVLLKVILMVLGRVIQYYCSNGVLELTCCPACDSPMMKRSPGPSAATGQ